VYKKPNGTAPQSTPVQQTVAQAAPVVNTPVVEAAQTVVTPAATAPVVNTTPAAASKPAVSASDLVARLKGGNK
jgi:hypothetical protein